MSNSKKSPEPLRHCINNVRVENVEGEVPEKLEKKNKDGLFKKLMVQQIHKCDLKPELVTQKLTNVQIAPDQTQNVR